MDSESNIPCRFSTFENCPHGPFSFFFIRSPYLCAGLHCSDHRTRSRQVSTLKKNNPVISHYTVLSTFLSQESMTPLTLDLYRWDNVEVNVHMLFAHKFCLRIACSRQIVLLREVELFTDCSLPVCTP